MKGFWTCGPFKEAADNLAQMVFKAEQNKHLMDVLEQLEKIEKIIKEGTEEERLLAVLMKLDIEDKLDVLLGIKNGREKKNDEISREALLKSFSNPTKI